MIEYHIRCRDDRYIYREVYHLFGLQKVARECMFMGIRSGSIRMKRHIAVIQCNLFQCHWQQTNNRIAHDISIDICGYIYIYMYIAYHIRYIYALILLRAAVGRFKPIMNVLGGGGRLLTTRLLRNSSSLRRSGTAKIVNCDLDGLAWLEAGVPIRDGGL